MPHDVRDEVVDFVRRWSERSELTVSRFVAWLGVGRSKFYDWRDRYGCVNEHNAWVPRDRWLEPWEKEAITATQSLTLSTVSDTTQPAGETDAGSAGAQPARDSRPGYRANTLQGTASQRRPLPPEPPGSNPLMPQKTLDPVWGNNPLSEKTWLSISG